MPVHQFWYIGVVDDIDTHRLAFAHTQHWPGGGVVITSRAEDVIGGKLDCDWGDAQGVVGFPLLWRGLSEQPTLDEGRTTDF